MRSKRTTVYLLCLFTLAAVACSDGRQSRQPTGGGETADTLQYAKGFSIAHTDSYTKITVFNPWKSGEVYDVYYLTKNETTAIPSGGCRVIIPLKTLMVNSATHLGFLDLLGETDKVTGVCDASYIYNPYILKGVEEGRVKDLGDAFNLDIEHLLLLNPQVVMTSAYNAEDENSKRMRQTGLTLLYNIEWQEKTLLGRAEWIKFMGAFFDKEALADSIFSNVAKRYNDIKSQAATLIPSAPTVLSGQDFRGTWSMPGGQSFNARLFQDAGARYYYAGNNASGSIATSIEEALLHFSDAAIWVNVQASTLEELGKMDKKYKLFKAYQNGNVYNTLKRSTATGGNDYWESGVARPDLLLSDMIRISHPSLLPDYELTYTKRLPPQ
ncbi:iron complex transport system substrate-binding protein [termite gut metagenome]|uniref:Iron complex transport system substrate-binding protein n=1 Tax=termite gut metagenome TaxID=433724 RepID=A0A5J4SIX8_9ZZZZ